MQGLTAAPHLGVERPDTGTNSNSTGDRRARRRGPRSRAAMARRWERGRAFQGDSCVGDVPNCDECKDDEPLAQTCVQDQPEQADTEKVLTAVPLLLTLLLLNTRSYQAKRAELEARLEKLEPKPLLVALTETWLDDTVEAPSLSGSSP